MPPSASISFSLPAWSAWAPGLAALDDWRRWAAAPQPIASNEAPKVSFLEPLQRRRTSQLTKMCLEAAERCAGRNALPTIPTVFGSRHGESRISQALLESLAHNEVLSPMAFSLSVHNTASGLFSIAARNHEPTTAVSAAGNSFGATLLEALGVLKHGPAEQVLMVFGDELVPHLFAPVVEEPLMPYALALLISSGPAADFVYTFGADAPGAPPAAELPQALQFVIWLLGDSAAICFEHAAQRWELRRTVNGLAERFRGGL